MKKIKWNRPGISSQQGNVMLITAIIILILSIIVATCVNLSSGQASLADISRDTSNTYYMAEDGIEKGVDIINKGLEDKMPALVNEISNIYIPKLAGSSSTAADYSAFYYDSEGRLRINAVKSSPSDATSKSVRQILKDKMKQYITENFIGQTVTYDAQSDRQHNKSKTVVTVKFVSIKDELDDALIVDPDASDENQNLLVDVEATAKTVDTSDSTIVYDSQKVMAQIKINVPNNLNDEIKEYYKPNGGAKSELLDNPIVCFSDVVVNGSTLDVKSGDMLVKGIKQNQYLAGKETILADAAYSGGVIVQNGGKLDVSDNLCVIANITGSNGWGSTNYSANTTIKVGKDAVANTIGVIDDYYEGSGNELPTKNKGENIKIEISKNAITDNDVMIGRWTKKSFITVDGTIFGTSGGVEDSSGKLKAAVDPNASSGVFSQGEGTVISADRMIIGGQPFITLRAGGKPLKLFESIGEPFDGVNSIEKYQDEDQEGVTADLYLKPDSPYFSFIKGDKITTHIKDSAAIAKVSATELSDNTIKVAEEAKKVFKHDNDLWGFLFQGSHDFKAKPITKYTIQDNYTGTNYIFIKPANDFYSGKAENVGKEKMYNKVFQNVNETVMRQNSGVKAYSIAMRSVFYDGFESNLPHTLCFDEVIDVNKLPKTDRSWSYDTPIEINTKPDAKTIDISKYYVSGDCDQLDYDGDGKVNVDEKGDLGCYPTIIVNKEKECTLTIMTSDSEKRTFNGLIISNGPVVLQGYDDSKPLIINGSVIIGGPEKTSLSNEEIYQNHANSGLMIKDKVEVNKAANVLFQVDAKDRELYRAVLDALKLTQYANNKPAEGADLAVGQIGKIIGKYDDTNSKITYTVGKLLYSDKSYLMMDTGKIGASIVFVKKEK